MLVKIRNKYAEEAIVNIEKFSISNWTNKEFDVYPYQGEYDIDREAVKALESIGFKPSLWSKAVWTINPDNMSHFSCMNYGK